MFFTYKIKDEVIRANVDGHSFIQNELLPRESIEIFYQGLSEILMEKDENGKFFIFHGTKKYINDWEPIDFAYFMSLSKPSDDEFCQMLLTEGIENFIFDYRYNDKNNLREKYKIVQTENRNIYNNYKIKLELIDADEKQAIKEADFYISDFVSLLNNTDVIKIIKIA